MPHIDETGQTNGQETTNHAGRKRAIVLTALKAACVTILALILSYVLASPMTASLSSIFATPEKGDFRVTDLYAQVADSRAIRNYDDRIVMIDIGLAGREEIAECLELLSLCGPKAVGIDVNFSEPGDNDSLLINAIRKLPMAVLPLGLEEKSDGTFEISDSPFFHGRQSGLNYGVVNLPAEKENASIREFATDYDMKDGTRIPSFVVAMARAAHDPSADEVSKRGNKLENIDYASREFNRIPIEETEENLESLAGRYIIIGASQESTDMHSTPVNHYVSGMEIHACSLSTLLDRKWIGNMPRWIDCVLAFLLCFIIIFAALTLTNKMRGLILRFTQLLFLFMTVWVGYILYLDYSLICNFSHTVIILAFGLLALDVWNGTEGLIMYCSSRFKTPSNKKQ